MSIGHKINYRNMPLSELHVTFKNNKQSADEMSVRKKQFELMTKRELHMTFKRL